MTYSPRWGAALGANVGANFSKIPIFEAKLQNGNELISSRVLDEKELPHSWSLNHSAAYLNMTVVSLLRQSIYARSTDMPEVQLPPKRIEAIEKSLRYFWTSQPVIVEHSELKQKVIPVPHDMLMQGAKEYFLRDMPFPSFVNKFLVRDWIEEKVNGPYFMVNKISNLGKQFDGLEFWPGTGYDFGYKFNGTPDQLEALKNNPDLTLIDHAKQIEKWNDVMGDVK